MYFSVELGEKVHTPGEEEQPDKTENDTFEKIGIGYDDGNENEEANACRPEPMDGGEEITKEISKGKLLGAFHLVVRILGCWHHAVSLLDAR